MFSTLIAGAALGLAILATSQLNALRQRLAAVEEELAELRAAREPA